MCSRCEIRPINKTRNLSFSRPQNKKLPRLDFSVADWDQQNLNRSVYACIPEKVKLVSFAN